MRHGDKPADDLLVLINFDPASYETYRVGVPREGDWELVFTSDDPAFGGSGYPKVEMASSKPEPWNGRDESIEISVPGLAGLVYRRRRASSYKPAKPAKKATGKAKSASARAAKPKAAKAAKTAKVAPKAAKEPTKTSRAKKA